MKFALMKINKISINNFLSIEHAEINFDQGGNIIRIVGINQDTTPISSNGAGKSSIIEAITFGLFGKTIRKTNDRSLKNKHTKGKCSVTLTVNDNIVIERVKKPPMLSVIVGTENCTQDSILTTQAYLEQILNTNYNVFLASMVFGQGNGKDFLTATPEDKRSILQSFLDVGELFKNRQAIRSLKSKAYTDKKVATTVYSEASTDIKKLDVRISKTKKLIKQGNSLLDSEKSKFIKKYSFSEIQEMERWQHDLDVEYERESCNLSTAKSRLSRVKAEIRNFKPIKCDHCGNQPTEALKYLDELALKFDRYRKEKEGYTQTLATLKAKISQCDVPISLQDFETVEKLKTFEAELKVLKSQRRAKARVLNKKSTEVSASQKDYDTLRFWETAFSENGLIKYIIKNILEFFTQRVNYYLRILTSAEFEVTFDETLKETVYNKGQEVFYDALSGGEKKRVSIAVMMGLNDLLILSGKDRSNLIFFDEMADSLDLEGVKGLYDLIMDISADKKIFIITHNDYLNSILEDESDEFIVEKKDGITKINTT